MVLKKFFVVIFFSLFITSQLNAIPHSLELIAEGAKMGFLLFVTAPLTVMDYMNDKKTSITEKIVVMPFTMIPFMASPLASLAGALAGWGFYLLGRNGRTSYSSF